MDADTQKELDNRFFMKNLYFFIGVILLLANFNIFSNGIINFTFLFNLIIVVFVAKKSVENDKKIKEIQKL